MAVGETLGSIDAAPALPEGPIYRLSVEQYHEMVRSGILDHGARVEFLEGCLVAKMTKHPPHELAKGLVFDALLRILPEACFLLMETPVTTGDSEPEPDVVLVRGQRRDYRDRHPRPEEVALVVEVSDSSLALDRASKARIYARAGIPAYWLVNLVDRRVEVHSDPTGPAEAPAYRHRAELGPGAEVPVVIGGREVGRIAVADLLP